MYLVDGFGTGMAMLSRTHHCIADGIALSEPVKPGETLRVRI